MLKEMFLQFLSEPELIVKGFYTNGFSGMYILYIKKIPVKIVVDSTFKYDLDRLCFLITRELVHVKQITIG